MQTEVVKEGGFEYMETQGGDQDVLMLHGLFGSMSNFKYLIEEFGDCLLYTSPSPRDRG